ncbi:hypothetical protein [Streptomyces alkaliphilus]|uniref:hypothetical protein n=1 Tax=Streptomyces alkaliphilus TaxID=1472722 RepID=UPI001E526616|nr:hypothetical protein [Streptomyces alkaliphilus]
MNAVKSVLLWGTLLALVWVFPSLAAAVIGVAGALAVLAAGQPVLLSFALGLAAGTRWTRRMRGWAA